MKQTTLANLQHANFVGALRNLHGRM